MQPHPIPPSMLISLLEAMAPKIHSSAFSVDPCLAPVLCLIASTISGPNPRYSQRGLLSSCPAALGYSLEEPQSPTRADRGCPAPTQHMNRQQDTPVLDLDMHLCMSTCDRQGDLTLFCDPITISEGVQKPSGLEQKKT